MIDWQIRLLARFLLWYQDSFLHGVLANQPRRSLLVISTPCSLELGVNNLAIWRSS